MITGRCNLSCPFCYGPDPAERDRLDLEQWIGIAAFLRDHGVTRLVIAGGEPTLSLNLVDFLRSASEMGFWIALQTNGTRPEVVERCIPFLEWLGLPLDASPGSPGVAKVMRTDSSHAETTLTALKQVQDCCREHGVKLKIGKVLSAVNIGSIDEISATIDGLVPDLWRIYEVRMRGEARANESMLRLPRSKWLCGAARGAVLPQRDKGFRLAG